MHRLFQPLAVFLLIAVVGFEVQGAATRHTEHNVQHTVSIGRHGHADSQPAPTGGTTATQVVAAERAALLNRGEAALAAGDVDAAAEAFERAANMAHAADAELGLVRSYMQGGHYRQALAFIAHTAGVHAQEPEGAALYAWLLHLGGQGAAAQRLLTEAQARMPDSPVLMEARWRMQSGRPGGAGRSREAALFAPVSVPRALSGSTTATGSGTLIDGGRHALAPLDAVAGASGIWVRNGLGQLRQARLVRRFATDRLGLLRLDQPLPASDGMPAAARDPFPGSIAYAAQYPDSGDARPEWPLLRAGFLGSPIDGGTDRELGVALPKGLRGGPVFDAAGSLAGLATSGPNGQDLFLPINRIRQQLGDMIGGTAPPASLPHPAMDSVYETAMRTALQVLVIR